ncbi:MAG: transaldolase family protein, partial [Clostridiales bacterium]|nr:transaldolase family protein [Clostridiales bacterium]
MKNSYFNRVHSMTPTRFWINNVTREQAYLAIKAGAVGCTQNPAYTWKMIDSTDENQYVLGELDKILKEQKDDNEVEVMLQRELVSKIAKIFLPIYEASGAKAGYVSIQGDPFHEDIDTIIRHAHYNREAGPYIMAKIPVTKEGLEAIEVLAAEKIPINATEVMAVKQALDVCEVYTKVTKGIKNPAPIYFSHITGIYDEYLQKLVREQGVEVSPDALWQAGISIAKKIYWMVREKGYPVGFIGGGARGLHHFIEMVGADCCITINWIGAADELLKQDPPVVQRFLQPTPFSVVDELLEKLEDYRKGYLVNAITPEEYEEFGPVVLFRKSFEKAWSSALEFIKK